jgi:hypothetical protein
MQIEIRRGVAIDLFEKAQELLMPMARHTVADHLAVKHAEGRKQGRRGVRSRESSFHNGLSSMADQVGCDRGLGFDNPVDRASVLAQGATNVAQRLSEFPLLPDIRF